jgi:predicted RNase H-like HicB family nuclease
MKTYHVQILRDGPWYIGRVLERPGVTTQAKTLDALVDMLRDAIEGAWGERGVALELLLAASATKPKRAVTPRGSASKLVRKAS